ncbi:MAG: hypothetical protein EOO13_13395 [Chitinophagaceae bacterium]|nr:MAG: hypothetical protein EOO13_13395 [Chitinophagaceae bacterium]
MKIVVLANDESFESLRKSRVELDWIHVKDVASFGAHPGADAYFDLREEAIETDHNIPDKPLFLNSVAHILPAGKKGVRINGWNGFLENDSWEIAGEVNDDEKNLLNLLNKKIIVCANEPGFISARILAMIINEAYFAKEEGVSTEAEIDTAMKLGTNYPFGPFEWAKKIGIHSIYALLSQLSITDSRYTPSPLLTKTVAS